MTTQFALVIQDPQAAAEVIVYKVGSYEDCRDAAKWYARMADAEAPEFGGEDYYMTECDEVTYRIREVGGLE